MTGIVQEVFSTVNQLIPAAGTPNRAVLYTCLCLPVLSHFSAQLSLGKDRDTATLATLSLQGRLSQQDSFGTWIKQSYPQQDTEIAAPTFSLILSQSTDLISKVSAAVAFYFTKDLSFYASLTNLLSYSEEISKVAQPILDKIASLPVPYLLQSTRVIAFAPVIVKLIYMALVWADPKGENKVLHTLKTGANKTSQALEFLWNLRFSLLCLGVSTMVYGSALSVVYSMLVSSWVSDITLKASLYSLPFLLNMQLPPDAAPSIWNSFLKTFGGSDYLPTTGFSLGLPRVLAGLQDFSAPYDIVTLEKLFNETDGLKESVPDNLTDFKKSADDIKSNISSALNSNKIDSHLASKLFEIVDNKMSKTLAAIVHDPQFETKMLVEEFSKQFKTAFCQAFNEDQTKLFIQLLKDLKHMQIPPGHSSRIFSDMKRLFTSTSTFWLQNTCWMLMWPKIQSIFEKELFLDLKDELPTDIIHLETYNSLLTLYKGMGCPKESTDALRSQIFKIIQESYLTNLLLDVLYVEIPLRTNEAMLGQRLSPNSFMEDSSSVSYERQMINLFGKNGLIHSFAITKEEQDAAYLLSAQFLLQRFELNLNEYLKNPPADPKKCQEAEYCLIYLAYQAQLDVDRITQSLEFNTWKKAQSLVDKTKDPSILDYLRESHSFDFAKKPLAIPPDFKFQTVGLPALINKNKRFVPSCLILEKHFPKPWPNSTWEASIEKPEFNTEMTKAMEEMSKWILEMHRIEDLNDFLSSTAIKNVISQH